MVHGYVRVCSWLYMVVCVRVCMFVVMYGCVRVRTCVCIVVCVHGCVCVCVRVRAHAFGAFVDVFAALAVALEPGIARAGGPCVSACVVCVCVCVCVRAF